MEKSEILNEIKRVTAENGGKPPGRLAFEAETGVKEHEWRGRHWARWSDAIREAGFEPNLKNAAYGETHLIEQLIELIREIGHFSTSSELKLKATNNRDFPSETAFRRLGGESSNLLRERSHIQKVIPATKTFRRFVRLPAQIPQPTKREKISQKARLDLST